MSPCHWLAPLMGAMAATSVHAEPLTYDQALALAARSAPSLQAKGLKLDAARAAARSAAALPDPKLALGLDNVPISGPSAGRFGADEMTMARVGLIQDVPNGAKRRALSDGASASVRAAELEAAAEARAVRLAAAMAWIELYFAERRLEALDGLEAALLPVLRTSPSAVASGATRPAEALAADQWRATAADRRSDIEAEIGKARAALARWTGDAAPGVAGKPPELHVHEDDLRAGLERLPALLAFEAQRGQAAAELRLATAAKRPDWSWEVAYQRRDPMFGDMVSAGVTVSLPLFSRSRQDPNIAARQADAARVTVEREAARRELVASLEAALADHAMHHARWLRAQETLVPLAEKRAALTTASYAAGATGLVEVIAALTGVVDARLDRLDREAEVARDAVQLVLTYGSDQ